MTPETDYPPRESLRGRVGTVIPAWYAADLAAADAERLLWTTLAGSPGCVDPADVVVVVDGSDVAFAAATRLQEHARDVWGEPFHLLPLLENRGKSAALHAGISHLLDRGVGWIAARDADGDHFLDDLPHLFRTGEQAAAACPGLPVCVVGRRASVHAPLGWLRGEFELLVNEVLVEGLAFALAREGRPWDTRFLANRIPDLQSGYKLYDRAAASLAVEGLAREAERFPDLRLWRTGMEVVPFVEVALAGGICAEAERKTWYDQPVTSYGRVDLPAFFGGKLGWALSRCSAPATCAATWIDGALARRPLFTDPQGRTSTLQFRDRVLRGLSAGAWPEGVSETPTVRRLL